MDMASLLVAAESEIEAVHQRHAIGMPFDKIGDR
jgi:hypothetical protein